MVQKSRLIISALILTTFMFGMFGGVQGQVTTVTPAQETAIRQVEGAGAPHGSWSSHLEETVMYLHSDTANGVSPGDPVPALPVNARPGSALTDGYFDYERPHHVAVDTMGLGDAAITDPQFKTVLVTDDIVGDPAPTEIATFDMLRPIGDSDASPPVFERDTRFYRIDGYVQAACATNDASGEVGVGVDARIDRMRFDAEAGVWQPVDTSNSGGHQPLATVFLSGVPLPGAHNLYGLTGTWESGANPALAGGALVPAGEWLRISLLASAGSCVVAYDVYEDWDVPGASSYFRFVSDAARISTWIENKDGEPTEGLPSAASTAPERRRFSVSVAHASTWPQHNTYVKDLASANHQELAWRSLHWDDPADSDGDIANTQEKWVRLVNVDEDQRYWDERTTNGVAEGGSTVIHLDRVAAAASGASGVNIIRYDFSYTGGLPEAAYQAEVYSEQFGVSVSPLVTVGLKGFSIGPSLGESLVHAIRTGEPTVYRVLITNTGAERDTITVTASPPGANWQADVINGRISLEAGGTGEVLLRVTPSEAAQAGQSRNVVLTAVSSFPNEVPAKTITLTTTVISGGGPGGVLLGQPNVVEIFPGAEIGISGIRIRNTGPAVDTYLLKAKFPGDVSGWSATITPSSRTASAASIEDFVVNLRAPASATPGMRFLMEVEAQRVGSAVPTASLQFPVEVILNPAVDLTAPVTSLDLRSPGSTCVAPVVVPAPDPVGPQEAYCLDGDLGIAAPDEFDTAAVFRVEITNPTPRAETYSLNGRWTAGDDAGNPLVSVCPVLPPADGSDNPDFWRMAFGAPADIPAALASSASRSTNEPQGTSLGQVTVPAHTTIYRFLALGYHFPSCGTIAPDVTYRIRFTSETDRSIQNEISFSAVRKDAGAFSGGEWANSIERVAIEAGRVDGPQRFVSTDGAASQLANGAYAPAVYGVQISNLGNEIDTLHVEVPPPRVGWSQSLRVVPNPDGGATTSGVLCTAADAAQRSWRCPNMGVGDEASLELVVAPSAGIRLRERLDTPVIVKSAADGSKTDTLTFTTQTVGRFTFDADALKSARIAGRGSDVTLPFEIDNVGTEGDTYTISIIDGPADWKPRLSSDQSVFIPGGKAQTGFVVVSVPQDAATGVANAKTFRVEVKSENGAGVRVLDFSVQAAAASLFAVGGDPSDSILLPTRGEAHEVTLKATGTSLNGKNVQFVIDQGSLPAGWTAVGKEGGGNSQTKTGANGVADVVFVVTAPADALATSRVPLLVTATADGVSVAKDVVLSLQAELAIRTQMLSQMPQTIIAGGEVVYEVDIVNEAPAQDTFLLTNTPLTGALAGWAVSYQPAQVTLGPLEARTIDVIVGAPAAASAGQNATFEFFATSLTDPGVFDSLSISTVVGFNELTAAAKQPMAKAGPDEVVQFVVTVTNTGTLPDVFRGSSAVLTTPLAGLVTVEVPSGEFEVPVNGSVDVPLQVVTQPTIPAGVSVLSELTFESTRSPGVEGTTPITVEILPYKALDIDGDSISEYAVDRDSVSANGFESFKENRAPGGKASRIPDLASYLAPAVRQSMTEHVPLDNGTVVAVLRYAIDGDKDGRRDHFIDHSGDGLPDAYWDPDNDHAFQITLLQDVDADAVADYFVGTRGAEADAVFNLVTGKFTPLLSVDIDGDGTQDFVVDKNGNGILDPDETVLYSRGGILVTVLKVDVDGDGKLDDVFDLNGDGRVDSFVRNGETIGREITLRDVNGDGILDWVYDSNLDGRADSYYDPAAQSGGHRIDPVESFSQAVAQYWYVPALFLLVVVLFAVLVAVTRR